MYGLDVFFWLRGFVYMLRLGWASANILFGFVVFYCESQEAAAALYVHANLSCRDCNPHTLCP